MGERWMASTEARHKRQGIIMDVYADFFKGFTEELFGFVTTPKGNIYRIKHSRQGGWMFL